MDAIETIEYKGYKIAIHHDDDPMNPMKDWDVVGEWVCWHNRYTLSTNEEFEHYSPDEFIEWVKENKHLIYPLYMYDHSGIAFSLSNSGYPFNDCWDTGQVGFVLVRREKAIEEWGKKLLTKYVKAKVWNCINGEVKTMNQYYGGEVYGYTIESSGENPECDDSCWGFYGMDYCIDEAKSSVDWQVKENHKKHIEQVKTYIRNRVPLELRIFDCAI